MTHQPLSNTLAALLEAGATLDLTNPDGTSASWLLARHYRIEDDDVLWIRPLVGGHRGDDGTPRFPLGDCLRRGIALDSYRIEGDRIHLELGSGQLLELRPAAGAEELAALELWDAFTLTVLTADEETALDRLDADSWQGRFT